MKGCSDLVRVRVRVRVRVGVRARIGVRVRLSFGVRVGVRVGVRAFGLGRLLRLACASHEVLQLHPSRRRRRVRLKWVVSVG